MKFSKVISISLGACLLSVLALAQGSVSDEIFDESSQIGQSPADAGAPAQEAPAQPIVETPPAAPAPKAATKAAKKVAPPQEAPPVAQAPAPAPAPTAASNKITAVDFRANDNGGTVVIRASQPLAFTTRPNPQTQQYVIEVSDVTLPKKFQRPYNTKEFNGAIGMFQAYQKAGSSTARFVVQMKGNQEPTVQQEGNSIMIIASGLNRAATNANQEAAAPGQEAANAQSQMANEPASQENVATSEATNSSGTEINDSKALGPRTLEDFLTGNTKFYGRRISIQVQDGDIRDVFSFIAEQSGLNIVLTEDVKGSISLKLRQIPWDQALLVVMQSKQLGYVRQGNILRISPLTALKQESDAAKQVVESQKLIQPLRVRVFTVSYAKASEMATQTKDFLSTRGKATADDRTNSLVITDIEDNIKKVEKLLKTLDTQTPQVLIEAKVVEARETFSHDVGINWRTSGQATKIGQSGQGDISLTPSFNAKLANASVQGSNAGLALSLGKFDVLGDLTATLNMYEEENKVKVISSPRIVTLNNVKASIEQITEFPIPQAVTTGSSTTTTITYKQVKLQLEVVPQITAEGGVIMQLKVVREFPGAVNTDGTRPINSRTANTTVLVPNGDTTVIGGIYQSDVSVGENSVPWFSKIPVLGWFFKSKRDSKEKNELLIFLTPRVLNRDKAFASFGSVVE